MPKGETVNNVDLCTLALYSGCKPVWADGILGKGWHCGCEDGLHYMDSQCSIITPASLQRKRHVRPEYPDTESPVVKLEPKAAKDVALLETWFKLEDQRS